MLINLAKTVHGIVFPEDKLPIIMEILNVINENIKKINLNVLSVIDCFGN